MPARAPSTPSSRSSITAPRSAPLGGSVTPPRGVPGSSSASTAPPATPLRASRSSRRKARSPCRRSTRSATTPSPPSASTAAKAPAPSTASSRELPLGTKMTIEGSERFATRSTATLDPRPRERPQLFLFRQLQVPRTADLLSRGSRRQGRSVTRCRPSPADPERVVLALSAGMRSSNASSNWGHAAPIRLMTAWQSMLDPRRTCAWPRRTSSA